ncbi:Hypothetical protein NTJ_00120 [Nesidiocoris tenuis]|uniref:Uncharacterized protein n=1 Tax=Nesidiocoris tenuis TaxID=355587 RepID=A0ABN7A8W3_9HEMI|nr:Hypothetical protein NTJ_00120 [Nesidiocoris tenuis]
MPKNKGELERSCVTVWRGEEQSGPSRASFEGGEVPMPPFLARQGPPRLSFHLSRTRSQLQNYAFPLRRTLARRVRPSLSPGVPNSETRGAAERRENKERKKLGAENIIDYQG